MTRDSEEQLQRDIKAIKDDVAVLKVSVIGDPFAKPSPLAGLVDIAKQQRIEIYGHEEFQHVGLKRKYEALQDEVATLKANYKADRNWVLASASALSFGIGLAWYFAQLFFGK